MGQVISFSLLLVLLWTLFHSNEHSNLKIGSYHHNEGTDAVVLGCDAICSCRYIVLPFKRNILSHLQA